MKTSLKTKISTLLVAAVVSLQLVTLLRPAIAWCGVPLGILGHAALGVAVYSLVFALFWSAQR